MVEIVAERDTFVQVHARGGYFRLFGYGFLVAFTRRPLYGLRKHGHHLGSVWWRILRPVPEAIRYDGSPDAST